jgi:hypothetical protein
MEEVLRQRLLRRIESLPEAQVYQVLDFVEFLESKYARSARIEPSMLQKFAEGVQDKMREKAMNPATLREAFQLIAAADRVLADVATAGKQILDELGALGEPAPPPRRRVGPPGGSPGSQPSGDPSPGASDSRGEVGPGEEWTPRRKPSEPGS